MALWGISVYFNPSGYQRRLHNYKKFRESSCAQGLKLITVELALNEKPFVLKKQDADKLIQVRSKSVLWHKEQLLNIGIKNVPNDAKYICWLDCDLIFLNNNWIKETKNLLKTHILVQPFESVLKMNKDNRQIQGRCIAYGYICKINKENEMPHGNSGTWGYGWAFQKDYLVKCGGLNAFNVVGGGDTVQKGAFGIGHINEKRFSKKHLENIKEYSKNCLQLDKSDIYCTNGIVKHLWHGDPKSRQYGGRHKILIKHDYDPAIHIVFNDDNCLEWSDTVSGQMKTDVINYFNSRNEDGKIQVPLDKTREISKTRNKKNKKTKTKRVVEEVPRPRFSRRKVIDRAPKLILPEKIITFDYTAPPTKKKRSVRKVINRAPKIRVITKEDKQLAKVRSKIGHLQKSKKKESESEEDDVSLPIKKRFLWAPSSNNNATKKEVIFRKKMKQDPKKVFAIYIEDEEEQVHQVLQKIRYFPRKTQDPAKIFK